MVVLVKWALVGEGGNTYVGSGRHLPVAKQRVARVYVILQRQREDFARKTASALISSHDLIALEDLQVRNLVRNRRLAKAISDVGWSRLRRWVEDYGRLHEVPVVAVPPAFTSQDCSGVLADGTPCRARIRKSLSVRTHLCPRCGLILDRDENAARNILAHGLALAREQGRWAQEATESTEPKGTVGHRGAHGNGTPGDSRAPACRGKTPRFPGWRIQESPGFIRAECQVTLTSQGDSQGR